MSVNVLLLSCGCVQTIFNCGLSDILNCGNLITELSMHVFISGNMICVHNVLRDFVNMYDSGIILCDISIYPSFTVMYSPGSLYL